MCHTRCECRRFNYGEYYIIAREGRYDGLKDWCESPKTGFRPDRDQGVYPDEHPRYSKDDDRLRLECILSSTCESRGQRAANPGALRAK